MFLIFIISKFNHSINNNNNNADNTESLDLQSVNEFGITIQERVILSDRVKRLSNDGLASVIIII